MKKSLFSLLLICFAFFGVVRADEVTVNDGSMTNAKIPVNGLYVDTQATTSEFIIPADAEGMEEMVGGEINGLTFYISGSHDSWGSPTIQVYIGEVDGTILSSLYGPSDFTVVSTSVWDNTGSTIELVFDESYTYNGGNLLIGTYVQTKSSSYKTTNFLGVAGETGCSRYNNGSGTGTSQNFLPKTTFTYEPAQQGGCAKPTGLAVSYTSGTTATVTWNGTASQYDIDVNGTVTNNVTSPYILDELELATTYEVKVRANCGDEYSDYTSPKSFTTDACLAEDMCSVTIELNDAYGDGGGKIQVVNANTNEVLATITNSSASTSQEVFACPGTQLNFVFASTDNWSYENGWVITDPAGEVISEHVGCSGSCTAPTAGTIATYTMNCSGCFKPSNLQATNIGTETADLSWTGNSDSYVLQYRPWIAAGDNVTPTATMTPYTFDLSQYSGTGSVVIRHYEVTNMFRLIVDDIQVTNAGGTVVYSQDFEDCGGVMPSEFSLMDMDGDGYNWEVVTNSQSYVNGTYGLSSASWNSTAGPLTPDNWIILSGIELGGSITFSARGQDANFAAETFCVYVCPDNALVEIPVNGTTYAATGLIPHSVYAWQVKGVCGDEESSYASAMFSTLDDVLVFATEGTWNNLTNWTDALGNAATALPTINDKVQIDANVTIPNGVVAYAKQATLNGGEITIADGGQLKMDATAVVTIEKVIEGYGESDGYYYFIASPLTTTRLTYVEDWSYVNAISGTYDLYTFDQAGDGEGNEWINYKANSGHANFTSGENNPVFVSMKGYLYGHQDLHTLEFQGSTAYKSYNNIETVDYSYDVTSEDDFNGWALVGNPYTCNAYISYVYDAGVAEEADFYTLNIDNTYTLMTSNDALAPCTGAIVNYSATGKVQFSSEAPATGKSSMLNMTVTEGRNKVDQARVRFGEGHNLKHMSFRNSSKLYMPVDGNDYAVVYAEAQGEMPVNFKAENNGTYTINFNTEEVSFSYLHLIDNLTGNDVDLLANPSYTFDANTSDYSSRFKLVFATGENSSEFAFVSNNNLIVNGEGTLRVIDMTGRIIATEEINGVSSIKLNAAAGVYVLQLNDKTQKIVIK